MKTTFFGIFVLLLVTGISFFLIFSDRRVSENVSYEEETTSTTFPSYSWRFEDGGEGEMGEPKTKVFLQSGEAEYELGTYTGSCMSLTESSWELLSGEISGAICWFAGGGTELGIFTESDGGYALYEGVLDEGSAEIPSFRGDFTLHALSLEGVAEVR
jgi:hypothetical protein